jgi:hypothetical protein
MNQELAALSTAGVAAIVALGIGVPQVLTLRQQNRIAAFDKRFAAFLEVQAALQRACVETQKPEIESIMALSGAIQKCWFIFPKKLSVRLRKAQHQIIEMRGLYSEIWDETGSPLGASNETLQKFHAAQLAAATEWEDLRDTFRPHMNLDFWS